MANRIVQCANADKFRRNSTQFVDPRTGICELCGLGLGKRFSRAARVDHQQGATHTHRYAQYRSAFDEERIRRYELQQQIAEIESVRERNAALELTLQTLLESTNVDPDWLQHAPCDSTAVKAALFDLMLARQTHSEVAINGVRAMYAYFKRKTEQRLTELAAFACLGCEQSAFQVSSVVDSHSSTSQRVALAPDS